MKENVNSLRKNPFYKGFFLFLPFPLSLGAVVCATILFFQLVIAPSEYFQLLMNGSTGATDGVQTPITQEGEFPVIPYESQWATLNVEGWTKRDIPVFFGDNNSMLRKGAGMWINSRFCGQNGKTVLSAHVTSYFYEIEDTNIGDLVTMTTIYGDYVYKVVDTVIFHYEDCSLLMPADGEDVLVMYTCYPRENGYQFKIERLALVCKKIEGKDWVTDE